MVMASNGRGLSGALLGSVSAKVVRHASCAVHVLR
ncbi:MAG: universal stress protein [Pseudomonadota bacterium]